MEKVIKKKGDKLYVKLKTYDNSFNRLTDKKSLNQLNAITLYKNEPYFS